MTGSIDELVTPDEWAKRVVRKPVLAAALDPACSMRRWTETPASVSQPRLDHHYVALHLGGAKRVTRIGGGARVSAPIADGSVTIVPAGLQFDWRTEGPIDYAHYYVTPARLARTVEEVFDKDGRSVALRDCVGERDPLLAALFGALMRESVGPCGLYAQALNELMMARLVRGHSSLAIASEVRRHRLAPYRLRRVEAYVDAKLGGAITLDDLATEAGLSRFHFARSFAAATGQTPHAFVERQRIARAKSLLREGSDSIAAVAAACGYNRATHFSARFRRAIGLSPRAYRDGWS